MPVQYPIGPGGVNRNPYANASANPADREIAQLREDNRRMREKFDQLSKDPQPIATIVELRETGSASEGTLEKKALIALGPAQLVVIQQIEGMRIGDRVLVERNGLQAMEIIRDRAPNGAIVTVDRVSRQHGAVEGVLLQMTKTFKCPASIEVVKGERVVLDPSMCYVIANLGKPPAAFSLAPPVNVSWDDIGGQAEAKMQLREAIEMPLAHPELFKGYGKKGIKGVLLWGGPGTGKTLLAKAAATSIAKAKNAKAGGFIYIKGPELLNPYVGKSEEAIRNLFKLARDFKAEHGFPAIVFIDECDAFLGVRDRGINVSVSATTVPMFLAEMDGLDDAAAIFILATNRPDALDPAVVREGRVDRKVKVDRPGEDDAITIFEIHLRHRPVNGDRRSAAERATRKLYGDEAIVHTVQPNELEATLGQEPKNIRMRDFANGAMIAELVERASTRAMLRDVDAGTKEASGILNEDLAWAIENSRLALADVAQGVR